MADREQAVQIRDTGQRKADVLDKLQTEEHIWVASANTTGKAHLVPLSFYWDGERLIVTTIKQNRTAKNLRQTAWARMALAPTADVVIIEGSVEEIPVDANEELVVSLTPAIGFDIRETPGEWILFRLTPRRIQAWQGPAELTGRDVMRDSHWLA